MRELLLVFAVIIVLLALTAIRYRKQIKQILGVAKMLREAKNSTFQVPTQKQTTGVKLVGCSKCGIFVPETSLTVNGKTLLCSKCRS